MQEEVEHKTISLMISATKLSGRVLKAAITKLLAQLQAEKQHRQQKGPVVHHGKQTVKQLTGQDQGSSTMETSNLRVRSFDRVARKYGVDYAIHRDKSVSPPKYVIFFKGRDSEAINAAFTEYSAGQIQRESKPRTSVLARLQQFKALVQSIGKERVREKQQEQTR